MTNKAPAFQWYPKDILASARVQEMSLAEEGAYRRLLDYCWLNGSVPADEKRCARLIGKGCTAEIAKYVLEMFEPDPLDESRMIHDRLEAEREKQESNSKARQAAAEARWNKQGTSKNAIGKQVKSDRRANANQSVSKSNANALQTECSSSSSASANNLNGSGSSYNPSRANGSSGKPPPAAAEINSPKRQWEELTAEEKAMSKKDFAEHLQKTFPDQNVRAVSGKLKKWCEANKKDFVRERLKGWLSGEGQTLDDEFLSAFGDEETNIPPWQKAINDCDLCDEKGLKSSGGRLSPCDHKQVKK